MDGLSWSFLCPIYDLRREVVVQFVDIVSILNHYQYIAHTLHLLIVVCLFLFVGVFTIGCTSSGNELHLSIMDSIVVPTGLLVLKNSVSVRFTIKLMIS
jgi:uncharacterized protein YjlB